MSVIHLSKVYLEAYMYRCHSALISYLFAISFLPPQPPPPPPPGVEMMFEMVPGGIFIVHL